MKYDDIVLSILSPLIESGLIFFAPTLLGNDRKCVGGLHR
jgi:hypothetical protein